MTTCHQIISIQSCFLGILIPKGHSKALFILWIDIVMMHNNAVKHFTIKKALRWRYMEIENRALALDLNTDSSEPLEILK